MVSLGCFMNFNSATVLRISVSKAKTVDWNGNKIATGIFKTPVEGKVRVRSLNLEGDEQADLTVHGGADKAVYVYPIEQYRYWNEVLSKELEWGSFGENLTVSGFDENSVCIGDRLTIGSAVFAVSQPRVPCYKLGIRLGDPTMVRRFYKSGKWGFYLRVVTEGEIQTGDTIVQERIDTDGVRLADVAECFLNPEVTPNALARVLSSDLAIQMKQQLEYNHRA